MKDWFKEWFNSDLYLKVYNHRGSEDAEKLVDLILSFINPVKQSKILDSACGVGRHSNYLAEKGFNVFGFDLSKNLLLEASERAKEKNLNVKYLLTDIRTACFKTKFDIILNMFTSFGYFENDEENFCFFRNAKSFLKDDGYLVIDYFNPIYLRSNLVVNSHKLFNDILIDEHRLFEGNRIKKKINIKNENDVFEFEESVALYEFCELKSRFEEMNFKILKTFGDYSGHDFVEEKSERIILILQLCA